MIGAGNDRQFGILCEGIERPDLMTDPKFLTNSLRVAYREELVDVLEKETKLETTEGWLKIFDGMGVPYAAVK